MQYLSLNGGYGCVAPPLYADRQYTCPTKATAVFVGPERNPDVPTGTKSQTRKTTFGKSSPRNVDLCQSAYQVAFDENNLDRWGQYTLTSDIWLQTCTRREYYTGDRSNGGAIPPNEPKGCQPAYKHAPSHDVHRLEIFCTANQGQLHREPMQDHWDNPPHAFTAEDCKKAPSDIAPDSGWSCGPVATPVFAGQTGSSFEVLDDGKPRVAKWKKPSLLGDVRNATSRKSQLRYSEGSPFRDKADVNGDTQPFVAEPNLNKFNTGWVEPPPLPPSGTWVSWPPA